MVVVQYTLSISDVMDIGDGTMADGETVMDNTDNRCDAVGRARGAGYVVLSWVVEVIINAHNNIQHIFFYRRQTPPLSQRRAPDTALRWLRS